MQGCQSASNGIQIAIACRSSYEIMAIYVHTLLGWLCFKSDVAILHHQRTTVSLIFQSVFLIEILEVATWSNCRGLNFHCLHVIRETAKFTSLKNYASMVYMCECT